MKDKIMVGGRAETPANRAIKLGLESTQVVLTDVGKTWFAKAYPSGIIYSYDLDGEFTLKNMGAHDGVAIVGVVCPMGIPYRFPGSIDGETTFRMVEKTD